MKKVLILLILLLVSVGPIVRPEVSVSDMTVTDYDGNTYNVAKIGNQFWMKENFRGTHYADGSLISGHGDPNTTPPAAYPEAPTVEGLLYNWDDATYKTLITGWHIPTDAEWKRLEMYLGMTREEANARRRVGRGVAAKLTEKFGTSGFDALYAGLRTDDGIYGMRKSATIFWTTTEDGRSKAWYRSFNWPPMNLFRDSREKGWAFSVRCLKDEAIREEAAEALKKKEGKEEKEGKGKEEASKPKKLIVPASEKNFNYEEGFLAYYAASGDTIDEWTWSNYASEYYPEIYKKYHRDEFMWRDSLSKIKGELNERIKRYDISTNYWRWSNRELGEYDFERKGFPLDIRYYDDFSGLLKNFLFLKPSEPTNLATVRLYPENPGDFNFLPYPEDVARKFLQSRRDEYGRVDREVTFVVHFTLLPVKGEESQAVLRTLDKKACPKSKIYLEGGLCYHPSGYNLVARINKVEVYEDEGRTKKIGELTKRYEAKREVEKPEEKSAEEKIKKKSFWSEYGPKILPEK